MGWPQAFQSTRPHGARPPTTVCQRQLPCFNPRARTGRDPFQFQTDPACRSFNPRARTGRDGSGTTLTFVMMPFQSTRPHGARQTRVMLRALGYRWFQSTRPHGARQQASHGKQLPAWFQSTRPHGARHFRRCTGKTLHSVSIHAPARGATRGRPYRQVRNIGFQSTRPHGARRRTPWPRGALSCRFNPRARTGRDQTDQLQRVRRCRFNPRARTGRDQRGRLQMTDHAQFQSTRPHGARQWLSAL